MLLWYFVDINTEVQNMTAILRMDGQRTSVLDELVGMQDQMNRMLDEWGTWAAAYPRINLAASENEAVVQAELPGMAPQNMDVSVDGDLLTIGGKREREPLPADARLFKKERPSGEFSRTVQLPFAADPRAIKASFKNGILTVVLPRAEADKPHRIRIEAA
jgi:HSP20 family protein